MKPPKYSIVIRYPFVAKLYLYVTVLRSELLLADTIVNGELLR